MVLLAISKWGQRVYVGRGTDKAWIKAADRDVLLMETTGADRPGRAPEYYELEQHLAEMYFNEAKRGQALKIPAMPRDINTFFAITNALKRARKMILNEDPSSEALEYFTADGKTMEDLVKFLNKLVDFKEYMASEDDTYAPIISQTRGSKAIKARAQSGENSLAMVITGTQRRKNGRDDTCRQ